MSDQNIEIVKEEEVDRRKESAIDQGHHRGQRKTVLQNRHTEKEVHTVK